MTKKILIAVFAFALGLAGNRLINPSGKVHAQISSPAYTCQFGNGGVNSVSPCAQYIVEIAPVRLGGGVIIYQVTDTPFAVNGSNISVVASGSIAGASVQAFLPNSSTQTITVAAVEP